MSEPVSREMLEEIECAIFCANVWLYELLKIKEQLDKEQKQRRVLSVVK